MMFAFLFSILFCDFCVFFNFLSFLLPFSYLLFGFFFLIYILSNCKLYLLWLLLIVNLEQVLSGACEINSVVLTKTLEGNNKIVNV